MIDVALTPAELRAPARAFAMPFDAVAASTDAAKLRATNPAVDQDDTVSV